MCCGLVGHGSVRPVELWSLKKLKRLNFGAVKDNFFISYFYLLNC